MNITIFGTGQGGGDGPVDYCIDDEVPTIATINDEHGNIKSKTLRNEDGRAVMKRRIPPPEVIRGDPERTRALIDSIDNIWHYTSGVIAFADEDGPSELQQQEVMDQFEKAFFPGLDAGRRDVLWVRHTHMGNVELHFVIPRVELQTGKAYNPAPPGWEKHLGPLRDYFNWKYGWARPDDLARTRVENPGNAAKRQAENLRAGLDRYPDKREAITEYLMERIDAGLIEDRVGIINALRDAGIEINRQGDDYISIRPKPDAKPIRLKGGIYARDFSPDAIIKDKRIGGDVDHEKAAAALALFESRNEKRLAYNIKRYNIVQDDALVRLQVKPRQAHTQNAAGSVAIPARFRKPSNTRPAENPPSRLRMKTKQRRERTHPCHGSIRPGLGGDRPAVAFIIAFSTSQSPFVKMDGGVYVWARLNLPAFVDKGDSIIFYSKREAAIRASLLISGPRWGGIIQASGDEQFRRDSWRIGTLMGLTMQGYEPTADELRAVKAELLANKLKNEGHENRTTETYNGGAGAAGEGRWGRRSGSWPGDEKLYFKHDASGGEEAGRGGLRNLSECGLAYIQDSDGGTGKAADLLQIDACGDQRHDHDMRRQPMMPKDIVGDEEDEFGVSPGF